MSEESFFAKQKRAASQPPPPPFVEEEIPPIPSQSISAGPKIALGVILSAGLLACGFGVRKCIPKRKNLVTGSSGPSVVRNAGVRPPTPSASKRGGRGKGRKGAGNSFTFRGMGAERTVTDTPIVATPHKSPAAAQSLALPPPSDGRKKGTPRPGNFGAWKQRSALDLAGARDDDDDAGDADKADDLTLTLPASVRSSD